VTLDLVVEGARVVDPLNAVDEVADIAIRAGRIACVGRAPRLGAEVLDASGCDVLPGLVDLHVHASSDFSGAAAHATLARAGVTTALDLAGPVDDVSAIAGRYGVGLTFGCLQAVIPGLVLSSADPKRNELAKCIASATRRGAIGIKILGGHFPLTPDSTQEAIALADEAGVWVAVHCGTTTAGSNVEGLEQTLQLSDGRPLQVAHINSYCRGTQSSPLIEAQTALELLEGSPIAFSESYVARINGTWGTCKDGIPVSNQTRTALQTGGFAPTEHGLEEAFAGGYAHAHVVADGEVELQTGARAIERWGGRAGDGDPRPREPPRGRDKD
jgi:urease alpha subunit